MDKPSLFGIHNSNRKGKDLWGKNQFNSSFPASLACYMREKMLKAVYLKLDENLNVVADEISIDRLFNTTKPSSEITFNFESKYDPYQKYAFDDIKGIDLVIKDKDKWCRPLEVKLTVIPDSTTYKEKEENWGSELVIRPATTSYCALGMASSCESDFVRIREIFEPVCSSIQHWDNKVEIYSHQKELLDTINNFQKDFYVKQKPFLLQPIWKTQGQSPILSDSAFDIFVWSDFALCRTFIDRSENSKKDLNRYLRSSARLARILYEISRGGKTNIENIYAQMTFGLQSDKEFALSGKVTRNYMKSARRFNPILPPSVLKDIILNGGEKNLSPERRFDQTIYYTTEHLFKKG
ncbi:HindVP family restriction endonuclease [Muricauda sp. CAU 1633]|uniref:HindVP family restriction endonuclease n=1 Tax=Allomuricauda sp. CAU 1633 TaxID=2816036 RepID=UPI001A8DD5E6|nr:HindVP family restriction endonuclease [Muricauda sp. CAU 1633]MBO0322159.1 HindVP family restriction endonuclease [Muricauda sp. CAU 1633]